MSRIHVTLKSLALALLLAGTALSTQAQDVRGARSKSSSGSNFGTPTTGTATPSPARSTASAAAQVTIIRPIAVTSLKELNFGKLAHAGGNQDGYVVLPAKSPSTRVATRVNLFSGGDETPLIRSLVGEPGRIYRVGLPKSVLAQPGNLKVDAFTLWSATRGDISTSKLGGFDAKGNDNLRLGATLTVPKGAKRETYAAVVPVTISYE